MHRPALLSLFAALPLTAVLALGSACSSEDTPPDSGASGAAGSGAGGTGAGGSGTGGSGTGGSGTGGTSGTCVDPRMEASLLPLTPAAGSGVWSGFQIDEGTLYFGDLDGVYAQPLAGGSRTTVFPKGASLFQVQGPDLRYVSGNTFGSLPKTGGGMTTSMLDAGLTPVLITSLGLVAHDQSLLAKDGGHLTLKSFGGGPAVSLVSYASKLPPRDFANVGDKLFFSTTPVDEQKKELVLTSLSADAPVTIPMPTGLVLDAVIGVVGDALFAVAKDDFLKSTVLRFSASGALVGSYVVSSGTPLRAFPVPSGVGIGGIQFLDVWPDGAATANRVRCFQVGAGVSSPFPTIHDWAANGSDTFLSIRTPEPSQNAIQRVTLP